MPARARTNSPTTEIRTAQFQLMPGKTNLRQPARDESTDATHDFAERDAVHKDSFAGREESRQQRHTSKLPKAPLSPGGALLFRRPLALFCWLYLGNQTSSSQISKHCLV